MMEMIKALREVYDVQDCENILKGGCVSGCCHSHIYYGQTSSFYDKYSDELIDYVKEQMGDNYPAYLFIENDYDLISYKNAMTWCAIECVAFELCDEELMKARVL